MTRLATLRTEVAECDRLLAELLARRSRAVAALHELKPRIGLPVRDVAIEDRILVNVYARHKATGGRYSFDVVESIWRAVFAGCEDLQAAVPDPDDVGDLGAPRL